MNTDTCSDYQCEFPGEGNHSHVGAHPYLRRVMTIDNKLIDGKTGEAPVVESDSISESVTEN